jgi:predicted DNA binding CopG/RHH family protein
MGKKLTQEEKEILDSYENEEWESVMTNKSRLKYKEAAQATFKKDKRVNIRISGKDLELLQEKALIEGIPYQTLMSSILHKYVYGNLVEKTHGAYYVTDADLKQTGKEGLR